jgi:hypothetical protein
MTETTYEEAKKCPKCGQPGDVRQVKPSRNNRGEEVEVHMVYCVTVLCTWHETAWVVQVNKDGSIPPAYQGLGQKQYPTISQESASRIEDNIRRQLEAETRPGSEIRNPNG